MPPQTWTAWRIDENGNRVEKKGDGSMPTDPWASTVPGTTNVNGQPPSASQPVTPTPPPPPANSTPANADPVPAVATSTTSVNTTPTPTPTPAADATPPPNAPAPSTPPPPALAPPVVPQADNANLSGAGASITEFATPIGGGSDSSGGFGTTGVAMVASFLIVFIIAAVFGFVYLRKKRRAQRNTTVEAAMSMRRHSSSADRAQLAGFGKSSLFKNPMPSKTIAPIAPPVPPKANRRAPNLTLSKIGAPVLVKATTDQEVLDAAIPAGPQNPALLSQLGFESMPVSPSINEFGNVPLGEMADSRPSMDHMRVGRHTRDPSFDFSRIDPSASMGGISSNALIASPKTAIPRGNAKWGDSGVKAPPFGSKRL